MGCLPKGPRTRGRNVPRGTHLDFVWIVSLSTAMFHVEHFGGFHNGRSGFPGCVRLEVSCAAVVSSWGHIPLLLPDVHKRLN